MVFFQRQKWLVLACVVAGVKGVVLPPATTPAPQPAEVALRDLLRRQVPDAASLARVILTALPMSLRMIAATDVGAVSSILWHEFLDDNKPQWFLDLPPDVQSYLIRQYGPSTAWLTPTTSMSSSASSSSLPSINSASSTGTASPTSTSNASASLNAPPSNQPGLAKHQKVGIGFGIGVPLGLLVVAALMFGCCFLGRRRRKRRVEGSEPPSSPGFIPRFSFQDRRQCMDYADHRTPLNPARHHSHQSTGSSRWEDQPYDPAEKGSLQREGTRASAVAPMAIHDATSIIAPVLYHTHSSNRARGTRTSYTSLRSVAEVSEPDESVSVARDAMNGQETSSKQTLRRLSQPLHMDVPLILAAPAPGVKRKPVSSNPTSPITSPDLPRRSLRRLTITALDQHSSSSSGAQMRDSSNSTGFGTHSNNSTPFSPVPTPAPKDPFGNSYEYLEDYGPEYSYNTYEHETLYGGHRSLDRYPEPSHSRKASKPEWPLKDTSSPPNQRASGPIWDRVYEH